MVGVIGAICGSWRYCILKDVSAEEEVEARRLGVWD
jgi:hypothetical protein